MQEEPFDMIHAMKNLKPHQHICLVYGSLEEWWDAVPPFVAGGLERNEKCLCICDLPALKRVCDGLGELGVHYSAFQDSGQLVFSCAREVYMYNHEFSPIQSIYYLAAQVRRAFREGYQSLRLSCDMNWSHAVDIDLALLTEYEYRLNHDFFPRYSCTALCQYDSTRFGAEQSQKLVGSHPMVLQKNRIKSNDEYIIPKEAFRHQITSSIA